MALEVDADGVHVGQEDLPVSFVRKKIGSKILGVSAHNVEEARQAEEAGADYLGVGPMYPTFTKPDIREVRGPVVIEEIRRAGIVLPIVGIGGIGKGKAKAVTDAGADGVAVISAITQARSPYEAAEALRNEIENS
jgi:thiamine-phosphate pyrophosphorylase